MSVKRIHTNLYINTHSPPPGKRDMLGGGALSLKKVISGGQQGADLAGLQAARKLGLETGGTAPPGFMTSAGPRAQLLKAFELHELSEKCSPAAGYARRSMLNVDNSDATVAFRLHPSPGTDKTIGYCFLGQWRTAPELPEGGAVADFWETRGHRPVFVVRNAGSLRARLEFRAFLQANRVRVLNVSGHREGPPGWIESIQDFLVEAIKN